MKFINDDRPISRCMYLFTQAKLLVVKKMNSATRIQVLDETV